jgi:hypothetical protein
MQFENQTKLSARRRRVRERTGAAAAERRGDGGQGIDSNVLLSSAAEPFFFSY